MRGNSDSPLPGLLGGRVGTTGGAVGGVGTVGLVVGRPGPAGLAVGRPGPAGLAVSRSGTGGRTVGTVGAESPLWSGQHACARRKQNTVADIASYDLWGNSEMRECEASGTVAHETKISTP